MDSETPSPPAFPRPRLAVSACLLGQPVRYDGGHKRHAYLTDRLTAEVDLVALCPEAGIGLGVPRPPIQLVGEAAQPRALAVHDPGRDVTASLQRHARDRLAELSTVHGCLLKRDSPSCGLRGVKLRPTPHSGARRRATGIFAAALRSHLPLLPLEQEDALDVPWRRERFLLRLYTYCRWQHMLRQTREAEALQRFHQVHAPLVMARSQAACRRLARYAALQPNPSRCTQKKYIQELLRVLGRPATPARQHQVLRWLALSLRARLDAGAYRQLSEQIQGFHHGFVSLPAVHEALGRRAREAGPDDFGGWVYLYPYPHDLVATPPATGPE